MRIDLSDLERLDGFAEALGRLFWCLIAVAFLAAVLGSAGTGLLVLILAAASFCARVGLEDFVSSRDDREGRPAKRGDEPRRSPQAKPRPEPEFNVYRSSRRPRRRTNSAV
jgi:hypothetical protein